jgi:hypothetical protein
MENWRASDVGQLAGGSRNQVFKYRDWGVSSLLRVKLERLHREGAKTMENIVPLIVQLVAGAVGGNVLAQFAKQYSMNPMWNSIAGAIGGLILTWICGRIPGLDGLVGAVATAAGTGTQAVGAAASTGASGLTAVALVGQAIAGLIGGGVLTAIAGAVKNWQQAAS